MQKSLLRLFSLLVLLAIAVSALGLLTATSARADVGDDTVVAEAPAINLPSLSQRLS